MVRLYYLAVMQKSEEKNVVLSEASDLSDFNFFRRSGVREFMRFSCCVLASRLGPGSKVSVREQIYVCHVFVRDDDLVAASVTDDEYPHVAAHQCLQDLLVDFSRRRNSGTSPNKKNEQYPDIKDFLEQHKTPKNGNKMATIQKELDETQIVLHQTLQAVLKREDNLDDLVNKTDELSTQAKAFYKTARKTNSCCNSI